MDDDKKFPQGLDDSFEEHELDLNTPEDLSALEDVTFSDTQTESMAIFDEFDDSNDFEEFEKVPAKSAEKIIEKDISMSIPETHQDDDLFKDMDSSFEPVTQDSFATDEEMFTSDAFDDVTAADSDFPEGDASKSLGDSQLFDYDPSASTTTEELEAEDIYAETPGLPPEENKKKGGGAGKLSGMMKSRRAVRVAVLLVLVGAVYAGLRYFMGNNANTMTTVAAAPTPHAKPPAPMAEITPPVAEAPKTTTAETTTTETTVTPEATHALGTPPAVTLPPEVAAATTTTTTVTPAAPAVGEAPSALSQGPQTTFQAPAPSTTITTTTATTPPANQDQIANKLNSLEASIHSIDDRLSHMSHGGTEGTSVKGAHAASIGNTFGSPPPESQEVLREALHKIEGIDKKMSYLAELETQVHLLNKEVHALKNDVVQQSMIVGQNQAHINQNLVAVIDGNAQKMIVQAAIPGRAWLRAESGQLLTVIPGDEVAGYGRVVSIDPITGTVVMSSRAIFREQ